jgi:hypothetical protein
MTREYRGESADEWLGISCPEDCAPLESNYDADVDFEAERDEPEPQPVSTPEQIAARRAFVERFFSNAPDFEQRLAMLDAEARQ